MPNLMISGFKTRAQVEAFINWYEGQGEQDACVWFECRKAEGTLDVESMPTDCKKTYPIKWDKDTANMVLKID